MLYIFSKSFCDHKVIKPCAIPALDLLLKQGIPLEGEEQQTKPTLSFIASDICWSSSCIEWQLQRLVPLPFYVPLEGVDLVMLQLTFPPVIIRNASRLVWASLMNYGLYQRTSFCPDLLLTRTYWVADISEASVSLEQSESFTFRSASAVLAFGHSRSPMQSSPQDCRLSLGNLKHSW